VKRVPNLSPCSGPAPDSQTSMSRARQFMGKSRKVKVLEIKNDWTFTAQPHFKQTI
jgi:hypothetical protein